MASSSTIAGTGVSHTPWARLMPPRRSHSVVMARISDCITPGASSLSARREGGWVVAMTETVNMHQAKSTLSRLVERALAGEDVVIARNGEPLVRLVPVPKERKPRVPGRGRGKIWIGPDFEFTDAEIEELFEAPLCADPQ